MQLRHEDAARFLQTHNGVLGAGWKEVESFDDIEDEDEYEDEEVEEYITLDMGSGMDARYLQTESTFQLIGLDTALPHLKIGNMVLQGEVTPLIGSEILLGLIRNQENPHNPSHPPLYSTSNRITFRPIDLWLKADAESRQRLKPQKKESQQQQGTEEEGGRSMFLQRPAKNGPNRPTVFPGRQRDRIRAEKRAQKARDTNSGEGTPVGEQQEEDEEVGDVEGEESPMKEVEIDPALMDIDPSDPTGSNTPQPPLQGEATPLSQEAMMEQIPNDPYSTPGAGPSNTALPSLDTVPDLHSDMFATGPRKDGHRPKTGRPKTRPLYEIHNAAQLESVNVGLLPDNVRILISPLALDVPPDGTDEMAPQSLEFTKIQFKRFITGQPASGPGSRGGPSGRQSALIRSGLPRGSPKAPKLDVPYLMTAGTPTGSPAAHAGPGAVPSPSPLRMEQVPDPPEGLEPEANMDVEGIAEAQNKEEEMEQDESRDQSAV